MPNKKAKQRKWAKREAHAAIKKYKRDKRRQRKSDRLKKYGHPSEPYLDLNE